MPRTPSAIALIALNERKRLSSLTNLSPRDSTGSRVRASLEVPKVDQTKVLGRSCHGRKLGTKVAKVKAVAKAAKEEVSGDSQWERALVV